jgi:hypothetical protein
MSGFVTRLIARTLGRGELLRPRTPTLFEPIEPSAGGWMRFDGELAPATEAPSPPEAAPTIQATNIARGGQAPFGPLAIEPSSQPISGTRGVPLAMPLRASDRRSEVAARNANPIEQRVHGPSPSTTEVQPSTAKTASASAVASLARPSVVATPITRQLNVTERGAAMGARVPADFSLPFPPVPPTRATAGEPAGRGR